MKNQNDELKKQKKIIADNFETEIIDIEKEKRRLRDSTDQLNQNIDSLNEQYFKLTEKNDELSKRNENLNRYILAGLGTAVGLLALIFLLGRLIIKKLTKDLREKNDEKERVIQDKTEELEIKNEELNVLLRELNHRIGNNINDVKSLIDLQLKGANANAIGDLKKIKVRINAIGLIHKHIYKSEKVNKQKFKAVDLQNYVKELMKMTVKGSQFEPKLKWSVEGDDIPLDIDLAVNVGIIINELVQNAFKYAFPNTENPTLKIAMNVKEEYLNISILDNGSGFPEGFSLEKSEGLGFRFLKTFIGKYPLELTNSDGAHIQFKYPIFKNGFGIYSKTKNQHT